MRLPTILRPLALLSTLGLAACDDADLADAEAGIVGVDVWPAEIDVTSVAIPAGSWNLNYRLYAVTPSREQVPLADKTINAVHKVSSEGLFALPPEAQTRIQRNFAEGETLYFELSTQPLDERGNIVGEWTRSFPAPIQFTRTTFQDGRIGRARPLHRVEVFNPSGTLHAWADATLRPWCREVGGSFPSERVGVTFSLEHVTMRSLGNGQYRFNWLLRLTGRWFDEAAADDADVGEANAVANVDHVLGQATPYKGGILATPLAQGTPLAGPFARFDVQAGSRLPNFDLKLQAIECLDLVHGSGGSTCGHSTFEAPGASRDPEGFLGTWTPDDLFADAETVQSFDVVYGANPSWSDWFDFLDARFVREPLCHNYFADGIAAPIVQ